MHVCVCVNVAAVVAVAAGSCACVHDEWCCGGLCAKGVGENGRERERERALDDSNEREEHVRLSY